MKDDDTFDELFKNALLYGTGVLTMTHRENGDMDIRVVPIEEYTEMGEALKWIDQITKAAR
jgi:hypothetical protein